MRVRVGTITGGAFHLTSLAWQASGTATGDGYVLTSPSMPALGSSGCCCTYLPCIFGDW